MLRAQRSDPADGNQNHDARDSHSQSGTEQSTYHEGNERGGWASSREAGGVGTDRLSMSVPAFIADPSYRRSGDSFVGPGLPFGEAVARVFGKPGETLHTMQPLLDAFVFGSAELDLKVLRVDAMLMVGFDDDGWYGGLSVSAGIRLGTDKNYIQPSYGGEGAFHFATGTHASSISFTSVELLGVGGGTYRTDRDAGYYLYRDFVPGVSQMRKPVSLSAGGGIGWPIQEETLEHPGCRLR